MEVLQWGGTKQVRLSCNWDMALTRLGTSPTSVPWSMSKKFPFFRGGYSPHCNKRLPGLGITCQISATFCFGFEIYMNRCLFLVLYRISPRKIRSSINPLTVAG